MSGDFYIFTMKNEKRGEMNGKGKSGNGMDSYLILRCLNLIFYMEEILKVGLDTPNNVVFS